jgi:mono/diheme cytochrome c family protein
MFINYRNVVAMVLMVAVALMMSSAAFGQAADLYKTKCAACHGADGKGDTAVGKKMGVKSFSDPEVAKNSDQNWFDDTKKGKGKMPAYDGKLTDDQIKELVKYMRTLK